MDADRRVAEVAAEQYACFERSQALECGLSGSTLDRRHAEGRLHLLYPAVYAIPGAPRTWHQRLLGACLAAGPVATASHRAAAQLWGLLGGGQPIEITVPYRRAPRFRETVVHRSTDLTPDQVVRRHGIPVTNPLRTMVDLGAVLGPEEVEAALDRGLVAKLFSVVAVEHALDRLARSGRSGCGVLRRVLDDRALGDQRPDGLLEPRMARLLRDAELPQPVFQHVVKNVEERFVARVDFAYPAIRLAIEVDGWSAHGARTAFHADRHRHNQLVAAGWTVLRFTWDEIVRHQSRVVRRLRPFFEA